LLVFTGIDAMGGADSSVGARRARAARTGRTARAVRERIAVCLDEARRRGDIPADCDAQRMACLLVDCWEGAALRSRLRRDAAPLDAMLDFYFRLAVAG
jgi:Tetracyclin repressor-like, C-terminal domain